MGGEIEVSTLGPVEVRVDGDVVPMRRLLERGLLVRLVLARGVGVSDERLADDLWEADHDAPSRVGRLRVVVSRLRRALGPAADAIARGGGGYHLLADAPDLRAAGAAADRLRGARRIEDHRAARDAAMEALAAWRGPALSDLRALPFARAEGERLDAWWLELIVHRLTADIALGAGADVVAELTELTARNPLHEPLRGMLAVALYRAGRQADALAELAGLRRTLAKELGVDPTGDTAVLEVRLLQQDPVLQVAHRAPEQTRSPRVTTDIRPALARGLVGRRSELRALAGRLDAALAGEPAVVLVEGGPGTGRTRMLEALALLGEQHGLAACWGRAMIAAGAPAYWPWRQAMRQWRQRADPAAARDVLARTGAPLARIAPELAPADGDAPPTDGPREAAALDPAERFGLFEHVVAFLEDAASAAHGVMVLLDDLHAADLASLLLLAHVASSGSGSRLVIAASLRPGELGADQTEARADLIRQPATTRIELSGLPPSAVAEQLAQVLGRECAPDFAADVALRTGGNPLFVQEIGRMMAAGGTGVPDALRDVVRHQLEAVPVSCREVLAAAAVLAGEVETDVVAAGAGRPVSDVLDELDAAVASGFLSRAARPDCFRFANDVVRDAVALDIGSGERARMHLRAAEHLESVGGGVQVDQIAHYRLEALPLGDRHEAERATTAAADLALRRFAFEDAAGLYDRALSAGSGDLHGRAELLLSKARAQYLGHDVAGAMQSCEDVAALAEHLGDTALLGRAAMVLQDVGDASWLATTRRWCRSALAALSPQASPLRAQLMAQLAVASAWEDDGISRDSAAGPDSTGGAALEMADRVGDAAATYTALRAQQLARAGPDGTHDRLGLGERMLGLVPAVGEAAELWGRLWRFDALVQLGRIEEAENELDLLEPVVARMRQPLPRWHLIRSRAALLSGRGRFTDAREATDEAVRVAKRGGHRAAEYPAHALRLTIAELTGDPVDPVVFGIERYQPPPRILSMLAALRHAAHGELPEAERVWARLPGPENTPLRPFMHLMSHAVSGTLAAAVGDNRAAQYAYDRLLPYAHLHVTVGAGVGNTGGSVHLALGTIAATLDRTDTAVDHLRAAVTANTTSGLEPYATIAGVRLADQLRRRGRREDTDEAAAVATVATAAAARLGMPLR